MRAELLRVDGSQVTLQLFDDPEELAKGEYKGRYFAYLEPWLPDTTTDEQRKHFYALIKDISDHTGEAPWVIKLRMKYLYMIAHDKTKEPSLARNKMSKKDARLLIQTVIDFALEHDIPLRGNYLPYFEEKQFFELTLKRMCWVCGRHGDLHHVQAVGMGRDRSKIDHTKHEFMCLCRHHHQETHQVGQETFMKKYSLQGGIKLMKEQLKSLGVQ